MPRENSNRLIEVCVDVLCEELGWEIKRAGSLTLTRDDLEQEAEPDSSYYIQNEPLVRDQENINIAIDPPPDMLPVEHSRSAIDNLRLMLRSQSPNSGIITAVYCEFTHLQVGNIQKSKPALLLCLCG